MNKYIGVITFKIDIEAVDQDAAEKILWLKALKKSLKHKKTQSIK